MRGVHPCGDAFYGRGGCHRLGSAVRNGEWLYNGETRTLGRRGGPARTNSYKTPYTNSSCRKSSWKVERMCMHIKHIVGATVQDSH